MTDSRLIPKSQTLYELKPPRSRNIALQASYKTLQRIDQSPAHGTYQPFISMNSDRQIVPQIQNNFLYKTRSQMVAHQ
jgi:hypothetical protein